MTSGTEGAGPAPGHSAGDRLDSWKEIAAYLRRGVRTVQRWEQQEGLPTHRHVHGRSGTVYAYRSELDAWARERRLSPIRLTSIVESSDDAIVSTTLDATIVTWNQAAERITGYTAEEAVGRSIYFLVPADRVEETRRIRERIERGDRVDHYETVRVRKDGRPIHVSLTVSPIKNAAGRVVSVSTIARDVTERKRAEERLLESKTRLEILHHISSRMIAEMSVDQVIERTVEEVAGHFTCYRVAYCTIDPQGILTVIRAVERQGMPPLAGLCADLKVAPEYLAGLRRRKPVVVSDVRGDPRMEPLAAAMVAGATGAVLDVPLHHSEGLVGLLCFDSPVPREWSEHEIETLKEVADCLSIAIRDARFQEERNRREEALRASAVQFRTIAETALDAIVCADHRGHISYLNPAAERMFGHSAGDAVGQPLTLLMSERFHDAHRQGLQRFLSTGEARIVGRTVELTGRRRGGTEFPLELSLSQSTGEGPCFVAVIRDVSELRHAERRRPRRRVT